MSDHRPGTGPAPFKLPPPVVPHPRACGTGAAVEFRANRQWRVSGEALSLP